MQVSFLSSINNFSFPYFKGNIQLPDKSGLCHENVSDEKKVACESSNVSNPIEPYNLPFKISPTLLSKLPYELKSKVAESPEVYELAVKLTYQAALFHYKKIDDNTFADNFLTELADFKGLSDFKKEVIDNDEFNNIAVFKRLNSNRCKNPLELLGDKNNLEVFKRCLKLNTYEINPFETMAAYSGLDDRSKNVYNILLDMTEAKKISPKILCGWSESEFDDDFIESVEKYDKAIKDGLSKDEIAEIFVPHFDEDKNAINETKPGDIFEFEGKACIRLNDGYKKLDISREVYLSLFPPINFSSQGLSGDCYLLSGINSMMDEPETKAVVLSCFKQTPDNKLEVKLPNAKTALLTNLSGDLPQDKQEHIMTFAKGSKGIKLLQAAYEDAFCEKMQSKMLSFAYAALKNEHLTQKGRDFINKLIVDIESNSKKYVIKDSPRCAPEKYFARVSDTGYIVDFDDYKNKIPFVNTMETFYRMDSGNVMDVYSMFGLTEPVIDGEAYGRKRILTPEILNIITQMGDNIILTAATPYKAFNQAIEDPIDFDKGLLNSHLYSLKIKTDQTTGEKKFLLKNPYNSARVIELNEQEAKKYIYSVGIAVKNN